MRLIFVLATLASVLASASASVESMQAVVVIGSRIRVQSVARPIAHAGEVLVKIHYAGVNPADWKRASGKPEDPDVGQPADPQRPVPGLDAAGIVESVGPGVSRFKAGDAVLLWSKSAGTCAQYIAVPADNVAAKPAGLSFAQAAGLPHAALAAWNLLNDVAKVRTGQTVLVLGGAGGVGSAAIQIAKNRGAHVIATTSAGNADYVRMLGAERVIDQTTEHFEEQLRNIDVAVNAVDADHAYRALAVVRRGGYLVSVAGLPSAPQCATRGVLCSGRTALRAPVHVALEQLTRWAQAGQFAVNIDRSFEMNQVLQAWMYSQAGHTRGKTVVRIGE